MTFLTFDKIKFFKNKKPATLKPKKGAPPPEEKKKPNFWKKLIQNPLVYLFVFVLILSYLIAYLPSKSLPADLTEGEIADSDIIAPEDLTIEDTETTENRRKEAEDAVLTVYEFDPNVFLTTEEEIREFFSSGREWPEPLTAQRSEEFQQEILDKYNLILSDTDLRSLIRSKFDTNMEENLITLIAKVSTQGIITSKGLLRRGVQERGFTLYKGPGDEETVRAEEILDIKESKQELTKEIDQLDIPQNEKNLLIALSHHFIEENIKYSRIKTDEQKELARQGQETIFYTIKKGKVILRKGDEITRDELEKIKLINLNLRARPTWLTNFTGTFLLFALILLTLWYYLKSILKFRLALRNYIMMGVTLIISLLFYKLSSFLALTFSESTNFSLLSHSEAYTYAFPFQLGVLLFAILAGSQLALFYSVINSLLVGYLFKGDFFLMVFCFIGSLAAIYGVRYFGSHSRTSALRSGLHLIAPVNIFVIITIKLITEKMGTFGIFASELIMGLIGGILSASLAFLFLPVFENLFGFLTESKLLELANSELPIFRQMAIEAPGSYHHSLLVASLAESAAEEIKMDPMLAKASALYHDIGKIKRPEYFIENKLRNPDIHKDLTPSMSTLVIINHVKEGVELAKKLKLPHAIREIIEQHHGNSLVRFFFQKAKEKYDPEMQKIKEEAYRYPGPIPKTREAALVLLADSVEAAARSLKTPSRPNLTRMINEILNSYLQDGQLDDCDFSLKELRAIASSFLETLYTLYHPRVEYPGFDFEMKKKKNTSKNKKPNDRNNKSTT
jgi:putative nucleotidyltransferase with HDIG domain